MHNGQPDIAQLSTSINARKPSVKIAKNHRGSSSTHERRASGVIHACADLERVGEAPARALPRLGSRPATPCLGSKRARPSLGSRLAAPRLQVDQKRSMLSVLIVPSMDWAPSRALP